MQVPDTRQKIKFKSEEELRLHEALGQLNVDLVLNSNSAMSDAVKRLLLFGLDVCYEGLSIADVTWSTKKDSLKRRYQVDCQAYGIAFSDLYDDLDTAVDKFMLFKAIIDDPKRNRAKKPNRSLSDVSPESKAE